MDPAKPVITSAIRLCRLAARCSSCLTRAGESGPRRTNSFPINLTPPFVCMSPPSADEPAGAGVSLVWPPTAGGGLDLDEEARREPGEVGEDKEGAEGLTP